MALALDATDVLSIKTAISKVVDRLGGLDILVNVVGGSKEFRTVDKCEEDEWQLVIDTNSNSVYRCTKYAAKEMIKKGGGAIVNMSSGAGVLAMNRNAAYAL